MLAHVETGARGRDVAFASVELLKIYGVGVISLQTTYTPGTMHGREREFHTIFNSMYKTMNRGCNTKYIAPTCGPQEGGYSTMKNVPATRAKPRLFAVLLADSREVQALEEFIALKERQINRLVRVDKNLDAILETEWLKDYIFTFPNRDRSGATMLPF